MGDLEYLSIENVLNFGNNHIVLSSFYDLYDFLSTVLYWHHCASHHASQLLYRVSGWSSPAGEGNSELQYKSSFRKLNTGGAVATVAFDARRRRSRFQRAEVVYLLA